MAGNTEHENIGARAEHTVTQAGHHHGAHLRVLETDALQRVVQLNVHAQVVAVEFEFVARTNAGVFIEVQAERGGITIHGQLNVFVLRG